jgi:Cysteine-rich CPCC
MKKYTCPCCGYKTIEREDTFYDLCPVCFWETDPYQLANPAYSGGANRPSLQAAQQNFILFGACEKDVFPYTRLPLADEVKDENWQFPPAIITTFTAKKIYLAGWHIAVYDSEMNSFAPQLKMDKTIISATLDHRFMLDLTFQKGEDHFPRNGFFVLSIREGNTGIHYFTYMNWGEAAAATQQFIDEINEINKTIDTKKPSEERAFNVRLNIDNQIVMSKITTWRNMDWDVEKFRNIQLEVQGETYAIIDTFEDFERMLIALQKSLPKNYKIETCFFCRFSAYKIYGNDNFGDLDCYKNCKENFLKADNKHKLIDLYETENDNILKTEETDYCTDFQRITKDDYAFKHQIL